MHANLMFSCPIPHLCHQDEVVVDAAACEAAVRLAKQRLNMYKEDAVVANQVLKPPPKKKQKADEADADN